MSNSISVDDISSSCLSRHFFPGTEFGRSVHIGIELCIGYLAYLVPTLHFPRASLAKFFECIESGVFLHGVIGVKLGRVIIAVVVTTEEIHIDSADLPEERSRIERTSGHFCGPATGNPSCRQVYSPVDHYTSALLYYRETSVIRVGIQG